MNSLSKSKALWLMTLIVFTAVNLLVVSPSAVFACSCMVPPPPLEALEQSTAVFAGRVTDIEVDDGPTINSADPVHVTFAVEQVWKGPQSETLVITTPRESASCGFNFEENREYVVYAFGDEGELSTNLCSRTAELSASAEDLEALGAGTVPDSAPAEDEHDISGSPLPAWLPYALVALTIAVVVIALILIYRKR